MADQTPVHPQVQLALEVSNRIEIASLRLLKASASQEPQVLFEKPPEIDIEITAKTGFNAQQSRITVTAGFVLTGKYPGQPNDPVPLVVSAEWEIQYSLNSAEGLEEKHFQAFGELNGIYNAWPYWREFVQNTLVRMGLPALTIPVYRATQKNEHARLKDQSPAPDQALPATPVPDTQATEPPAPS